MSIVEITTGFGEKLRKLRSEKGITQEILAKEMNVTRQTISGWERGRSEPDIATLINLSNFFSITIDELLSMGGIKMIVVNYRRGGLIMLPFVTIGIIIALIVNAPWIARCSIALFGYITSIILILLGKRITKFSEKNLL
ncbi:helix-turn-helix domain-containing protein [Peptostreptococcaceae bacterium OttesenSCG-928-C18]|nr:helix-turn-helix domain-containing protein [Peptostreptococcaceae bacterium OttesenSCG-928-C18]